MENNFREILFLIEQIDVLKALLRDTRDGLHYSWNADEGEDPEPLEATDEVRALGGGGRTAQALGAENSSAGCHESVSSS